MSGPLRGIFFDSHCRYHPHYTCHFIMRPFIGAAESVAFRPSVTQFCLSIHLSVCLSCAFDFIEIGKPYELPNLVDT